MADGFHDIELNEMQRRQIKFVSDMAVEIAHAKERERGYSKKIQELQDEIKRLKGLLKK